MNLFKAKKFLKKKLKNKTNSDCEVLYVVDNFSGVIEDISVDDDIQLEDILRSNNKSLVFAKSEHDYDDILILI